jgi:prefoldin subunit 5
MLEQIFLEMDTDQNGNIDVQEFIDLQFKAFKNCEDNIEFLAKDIKSMDMKIKEVELKLSQLKERESGFRIDGIPIMKGSTLTFNIIDGEFDD